jgi:hypothetical protein
MVSRRHPGADTLAMLSKSAPIVLRLGATAMLGMNGSILAHWPSPNQNKFACICWPPDSIDQPVESQHG